MGLLSRWRRRRAAAAGRPSRSARSGGSGPDSAHLEAFARSRTGVEAYVEPATNVTPTTLLLIAQDGEWTRRRVPDPATAGAFARRVGIPVYDVNLTGYPQKMRDWTARRRAEERGGA